MTTAATELDALKTSITQTHSQETLSIVQESFDKMDAIQEYSVKNVKEWHQSCVDMLSQDMKNAKETLNGLDSAVCEFDRVFVSHLEDEEKLVCLPRFIVCNNTHQICFLAHPYVGCAT